MRVGARESGTAYKSALLATTAVAAVLATASAASAGGFAIREQSSAYQGMSFAGNAAGDSLSAMFWNSAATANQDGLNTESSYTIISPESKLTVTDNGTTGLPDPVPAAFNSADPASGDIGRTGFVGASYGSYQLTKNIFVGMAVNAPFGLKSDPSNYYYQGSVLAQKSELKTYNFNPTVAIRIAPGITIGAGAQIETGDVIFRFNTLTPSHVTLGAPYPQPLITLSAISGLTTKVEGNGWGYGGTAGVMIEASPTTTIGIGYRSQIDQDIDGHISTEGTPLTQKTEATLKLPDVVTVSIRQVVSPVLRLNGTFEWTNWSRLKNLSVIAAEDGDSAFGHKVAGEEIDSLAFNWSDGYFVSAGAEYDIYPTLTGRFGVGYEWSPIDSPEKRLTAIPDANRVWLSGGFSWQFTPTTTIDFAYSHLFVEDVTFAQTSAGLNLPIVGDVDSKLDIVSIGVKTHW